MDVKTRGCVPLAHFRQASGVAPTLLLGIFAGPADAASGPRRSPLPPLDPSPGATGMGAGTPAHGMRRFRPVAFGGGKRAAPGRVFRRRAHRGVRARTATHRARSFPPRLSPPASAPRPPALSAGRRLRAGPRRSPPPAARIGAERRVDARAETTARGVRRFRAAACADGERAEILPLSAARRDATIGPRRSRPAAHARPRAREAFAGRLRSSPGQGNQNQAGGFHSPQGENCHASALAVSHRVNIPNVRSACAGER